jgi:hypothetical protein
MKVQEQAIKSAQYLVGSIEPEQGRFLALCAVVAFFAGGAKAVIHRNGPLNWRDMLAGAVASTISGTGIGCALLYLWPNDHELVILPLTSVAAWIGVALLDFAGTIALRAGKQEADRRLGQETDEERTIREEFESRLRRP